MHFFRQKSTFQGLKWTFSNNFDGLKVYWSDFLVQLAVWIVRTLEKTSWNHQKVNNLVIFLIQKSTNFLKVHFLAKCWVPPYLFFSKFEKNSSNAKIYVSSHFSCFCPFFQKSVKIMNGDSILGCTILMNAL